MITAPIFRVDHVKRERVLRVVAKPPRAFEPVDRAYLLAIKHKCEEGIPYDIALRTGCDIRANHSKTSKALQNERPYQLPQGKINPPNSTG